MRAELAALVRAGGLRLMSRPLPCGRCGLLGRQAADIIRSGIDPVLQRWAAKDGRLDEDHAFHGAPGEVHRPHVRPTQGTVGAIVAESHHEGVLDDAAEHVATEHERQAAEHLPFGYCHTAREYGPYPVSSTNHLSPGGWWHGRAASMNSGVTAAPTGRW